MLPQLVIFDLDNTLVITRPAAKKGYKAAIAHLAKRFGLESQKDKLYAHWKRLVQKLMLEKNPKKRGFRYSLSRLHAARRLPENYLEESYHLYQKTLLASLSVQAGAAETLQTLKDQGCLLAVATGSTKSDALKKLKQVNLYKYLDFLITATDVGWMKPDPAYYQLLLNQSGVNPQAVLVVGDDQREDLDPAAKLGLNTLLFPKIKGHLGLVLSHLGLR